MMLRRLRVGFIFFIIPAVMSASGPWDGLWFRDAEKSHRSDHTYTLAKLPDAIWKYDDGADKFTFAVDGKPYPTLAGDFTIACTGPERTMDCIYLGFGRELRRVHRELSIDGKTMTSRITRTASDGRVVERVATAARVAGTTGFEGKWKELGDAGALGKDPKTDSPASQLASQSGQPSWVISTSSDGVISWYVPATGELIRGKADGQPRPITGPQIPAGTTFVWKQISPYQLEFYASGDGRLREAAVEILAPDGKTFTDKLWKAGHEDEKDVTVYVKR